MNPVWQWAVGILLGIVVAGGGAWITWGRAVVRRDELHELISLIAVPREKAAAVCETHCPYLADKKVIELGFKVVNEKLDRLLDIQEEERKAG